MSNTNFDTGISVLQKSSDPKTIQKALGWIRKEVDWPKNKNNVVRLRDRGCLKQITAIILNTTHRNCIDLALSILGNCLMERTCTTEVITQHNIMSVLNQLLKKHPKEDSINGRTFRIIGNMCQHREQWSTILIDKKPFIVSHLVDIVKKASRDELDEGERISEATIVTSIRALRELLNCHTITALVMQFGALKAIGALFIKYCLKWQQDEQNKKVLLDIVRVIQEYSKFNLYHAILEMQKTERGNSLVYLSSVVILAPRRIVKIVMNYLRSCQLQSELPITEICGEFMQVLEKHSIVKEFNGHYSEYLKCLCYLLDHPANRNATRCGQAIPLLMKVLKEFEELSDNNVAESCILLINALNKFKHDDQLLLLQLEQGIIQILIDKLTWIVGPPEVLNLKHASERKRKYIFGLSGLRTPEYNKRKLLHDETLKECSPSSSDDDADVFDQFLINIRCRSSCSSSDSETAVSWSEPSSSPTRSLVNESDSDNYSPVCSEADDTEFFHSPHDNDDAPVSELEELFDNDFEDKLLSDDKIKSILTSLKNKLCLEAIKLLKSFIKLQPPQPQLANVDLLMQLTKCGINRQFDVINIICDIVKCHQHLIPIIRTDYIKTLTDIEATPHDSCTKCSLHSYFSSTILRKFSNTAECGAGKGYLARMLLKGDTEAKENIVMVLPYIIGNASTLARLMLKYKGLDVLMKLFQENNEQNNRRCIKVLNKIASNQLLVNTRKFSKRPNWPKLTPNSYKLPVNCEAVMTLKFDNGALIKADRDFLVTISPFFDTMLNGNFMESGQSEIHLSEVEPKNFSYMLYLLKNMDNTEVEVDLDLETLLDVIMLSDRYLIKDLCLFLTASVEQFHISSDTVPIIYKWSIEFGASAADSLRLQCVAYALMATDVDQCERYALFQSLFNLGYTERFVRDIESLLTSYLHTSDCNQILRDVNPSKRYLEGRMRDNLLKDYV
ncbi:unnamed protein product [Ceutorhynchus assimilis]|uniref:BTB domain-containing protein n=1 Tax=Ceutorhynchus assimilis TaxID=467358 RepID=A0A9N9QHI3_9CUCU|nr:unnamed protein product [Ceutorhynchus assimilis]